MKRILCYGDSNTWGTPDGIHRMSHEQQWPILLQRLLGTEYIVYQEGQCARVAGDYEPLTHRNGKPVFEPVFRTSSPVNVVIIALGTNDLKQRHERSADQLFADLEWYQRKTAELAAENEGIQPVVIYMSIPNLTSTKGYFEVNEQLRQTVNARITEELTPSIILPEMQLSSDLVHFSQADHITVATLVHQKLKELNI